VSALSVFKSSVQVHDSSGRAIGAGMAYLHLRQGAEQPQRATGTVSLKAWQPEGEAPAWLRLDDGRRLAIEVSRDVLSDCSRNHILRYHATWPPVLPDTSAHGDAAGVRPGPDAPTER
jgi:hypothetical protein